MAHPHETLKARAAEYKTPLLSSEFAAALDKADELAECRKQFHIPQHNGKDIVYLCGNSLGLQHKGVRGDVDRFLSRWAEYAIDGHFQQPDPWFEVDELLREPLAKIVGAAADEVVLMNTLTVNLHLMMAAFYNPQGSRRKILIERHPFPSDMYAVRSQLRLKGSDPDADLLEVGMEDCVKAFDEAEILRVIEERGEEIALVMLSGVHFLTGQFFDIERITKAAKAKGCVVGWDLAHAAGNVELKLHEWGVDWACWCTYKYLNSGPGNISGVFVHSSVDCDSLPRLEGWWGHKRSSRFKLKHEFEGTPGAASFQLSNPGMVNMVTIGPGLRYMAEIGMDKLRAKSLLLTGYMELLIKELLPKEIEILSPADVERRGCQLSIRVVGELVSDRADAEEYQCGTNTGNKASVLQKQMEARGITCDNRPPDVLRLPPVPLYNSFSDVYTLVTVLRELIRKE